MKNGGDEIRRFFMGKIWKYPEILTVLLVLGDDNKKHLFRIAERGNGGEKA